MVMPYGRKRQITYDEDDNKADRKVPIPDLLRDFRGIDHGCKYCDLQHLLWKNRTKQYVEQCIGVDPVSGICVCDQ